MKNLQINTQGIQGKQITRTQRVGFIALFSDSEKIISVDNYNGYGNTYKQMKEPVICIFGEGQNDCIFEGSHEQLVELIKANKS